MHRLVDIFRVSRVEYVKLPTEADMFLYEVYFINKWHPPLNQDDRAHDDLTVDLPETEWKTFELPLMEKWKTKMTPTEQERQRQHLYGAALRLYEMEKEGKI